MKSVNILDFGAVADTGALQTEMIQAAIDYTFKNGGGEVVIPEGEYLTGGIRLRSNITLHLLKNAKLRGSRDPEDYFGYLNDEVEPLDNELITDAPWCRAEKSENRDADYKFFRTAGSRWNNALIRAINAENVSIIGEDGAIIDGNDCYDEKGEEYYRGPHCIGMFYCSNIKLKSYSIENSSNWAHSLFWCQNVDMDNVTVIAGHDGIHMTGCKNITIDNSRFYTGDDCVAGFANLNLTVENCELNSACSAMRLGGTNVFVHGCHIYGPAKYTCRGDLTKEEQIKGVRLSDRKIRNNMLSVFTYYSDYSVDIKYQPGNVTISDCNIECADKLLHYNFSGNEMWQCNRPLTNIRIEKVIAKNLKMPAVIYGDDNVRINAAVENCELTYNQPCDSFIYAANFEYLSLKNTKIIGECTDSVIKVWGKQGEINDIGVEKSNNMLVISAKEDFECSPI